MASPWIPLADADDPGRHGNKAVTLAKLKRADLPVLPGWVLPVDVADPAHAPALLDLHSTSDWMVRSSSPHEDLPEASAAGLFHSEHAAAVGEDLRAALRSVVDSARDDRLQSILGTDRIEIAVLAQPYRSFDRWCTLEIHDEGHVLEGWDFTAGRAPERWTAQGGDDDDREPLPTAREAMRVLGLERALFEIGIEDDTVWLLQARSAPRRHLPATADPGDAPDRLVGLGPDVHPGDAEIDWRWDREHSPVPLCPLLATVFGRWIAADARHTPSRLIDGRWHDRPSSREHGLDMDSASEALDHWNAQIDRVREHLDTLDAAVDALDGTVEAWQHFLARWLDAQSLYFDTASGRLRRWVRAIEDERGVHVAPAPGATVAARRRRRWIMLGREILGRLSDADAVSLATWWREHADDPLARDLDAELERSAHLCALPYDGRAIPWEEDPAPFLRTLLRHGSRETEDGDAPGDDDETLALARAVVTTAEDDDDVLLRVYLRWRHAVVSMARVSGTETDVLLDLVIDDLEDWARTRDDARLRAARRRGRAVDARWRARLDVGAHEDAVVLSGRAAAPGRVEGTVVRAVHLGDLELDDPETIAVVESVLPADASFVPFVAGLVCESGDVLGHASILAREAGIPCVVDVDGARRALARTGRVIVDGDRGRVIPADV